MMTTEDLADLARRAAAVLADPPPVSVAGNLVVIGDTRLGCYAQLRLEDGGCYLDAPGKHFFCQSAVCALEVAIAGFVESRVRETVTKA